MRPLLPLLLLAYPLVAQDKPLDKLAGSYTVTEFRREGKPVPDDVKKGVTAVKFDGDKFTVTMSGKTLTAKVKLDATRKPAEIDLYPQTEPFEKDRPFKGIYEMKDKTLTITYVEDGERPKEFTSEAKTSTKLVLERK
jgi:uncharacterized protein (TIGR03067 family)